MTVNLLEKIDLDDVLAKFSIRGRYHGVTAVWLTLGLAYNTMCYSSYVLIAEEVKYSCANDISLNNTNKEPSLSHTRNITTTQCNGRNLCDKWIYENPNSFVAEFQLACLEWKRSLVGPVHIFGYAVGVMIVGALSDRYFTKYIYDIQKSDICTVTTTLCVLGSEERLAIATGFGGAVFGLAKSCASSYWIYLVFEFLEASLGDPYSTLYTLGLETVATKSRVTYTTVCSLGLVIGGMLFPLIKWLVPYWRTCLIVMHAPGLLFILLTYLVDESPRWLLTKGKRNVVVKNLEKAAKLEKIEINENLTMISFEEDVKEKFATVIADTFKSRPLLKRFSVCVIWWTTCNFLNYGLMINSVLLQGNKYVNFGLVFFMRLPSSIIAAYILNKFNRKVSVMSCFLACSVICFSHPFIPQNIVWLVVTMYMVSQMISGLSFTINYIFTSELFPTYTRNSMHAFCSCLGRVGGIVATQMPLLRVYWTGLPIVLFGTTSLVAALVTLLVPDTAKAPLPDTVRQAEALGALRTRTTQENCKANR